MIRHTFKPYADNPELCVEELPRNGDTCNQHISQHETGDTNMTQIAGTAVYTLRAEINGPSFDPGELNLDGEYNGISTVHATLEGALAQFDEWLDSVGIDRDTAHWGETRHDTFVGNDPDPDLLDGDVLHWGINKTVVRP